MQEVVFLKSNAQYWQRVEEILNKQKTIDADELTRLYIRLTDDLADVADANERGYDGPLERLLDFEALPPGSILAHCVHCGAAQVTPASVRPVPPTSRLTSLEQF